MNRLRLLCAAVALSSPLIAASALPAADWARFRGANGSGVAEGTFDGKLTEKDVAWTVDLPGKGHCSPSVYKDRVYLTSADVEEGKRYVLCLSAADGKTVWKKAYEFEKFKQHADNSFASATPAVDDAGVYVAWCTPEKYTLIALSHEGKELWSQDLGKFTSVQGQGTSPVVVDDAVIIANDQEGPKSSIAAFDRRTGNLLWSVDRKTSDKTSMSTPVLFAQKGRPPVLVFTSKSSGMTAIDPKTGTVAWEAPKVFDARTVGSPVVAGDLVIGACGEGGAHRVLVAVRPGKSEEEPAVAYTIKGTAPYVPSPLVKGDRLYMWADNGGVSCVNATTGAEVWAGKVGGLYYGSPVLVGDALWCVNRKGELVGVSAAGEKFEQLGKIDLKEPSHATPAVAGDKMYVRTVTKLVCFKLKAQ
ncbi:MAG TPA: PQQ-binding-like beta-propeller repeat protein [Humisphaera sp.]